MFTILLLLSFIQLPHYANEQFIKIHHQISNFLSVLEYGSILCLFNIWYFCLSMTLCMKFQLKGTCLPFYCCFHSFSFSITGTSNSSKFNTHRISKPFLSILEYGSTLYLFIVNIFVYAWSFVWNFSKRARYLISFTFLSLFYFLNSTYKTLQIA